MPRILFFGCQITELAESGFRCSLLYIYKVPLRDVVGLKSRGCRKLKRVDTEHRRSCVYERCEVHWCCTAAAAVVPLLTVLPGCFRDPEEVWVGIVPLCVEDGSPA